MTFHLNVPDKNDDAKAYVTLVIDTCKHAAFQKKFYRNTSTDIDDFDATLCHIRVPTKLPQ